MKSNAERRGSPSPLHEPTLRAATGGEEQAEHEVQHTRRRRTAAILLAAVLVAGVGGATALVLNGSTPELDAAAKAREALRNAEIGINEALDPQTNLLVNDPARVKSLLLAAVANLNLARERRRTIRSNHHTSHRGD